MVAEVVPAPLTTTDTWAYEAHQAHAIITALRWFGVHTTVHGSGLVRHVLDFHASLERPNAE